MNHWNVMDDQCDASTSTQRQTHCKWLHLAWWFPALVSFHPGSHQISVVCAESAACGSSGWLFKGLRDWQVYSPSKCEGIVSLCCTWASCWLCTQTGKLKTWITGFVFSQILRNVMEMWLLRFWDFNHFDTFLKLWNHMVSSSNKILHQRQ